jgi:hypothetical protein
MNPIDEQLNRLFRAAMHSGGRSAATPPYGLETRVLAAWHEARAHHPSWDMGLLVRGLILAVVIMGASLWPVMSANTNPLADCVQLADSTIQLDNNP